MLDNMERKMRRQSQRLQRSGSNLVAESMTDGKSLRRLLSGSQFILGITALGFLLYFTRSIVLPLVMAFLLYSLMIPILDRLEGRLRMPRLLACTIVYLLVAAVPLLLLMPFSSVLNQVIQDAHLYRAQIASLAGSIDSQLQGMGIEIDQSMWVTALADLPYSSYLTSVATWMVDLLIFTGLVMLFFLFILASRKAPSKRSALFNEVNGLIGRYLLLKAGISAMTASSVGVILWLFGLEFALLIAVLTFFLNFIPNLGSIVATLLPLPMALLDYQGLDWFLGVMLLPAAIQILFGNVVEPKLQGDRLKLHPITILVMLLVWGLLWGPAGMFVAVPLTTVAKILIDRSARLGWLAQLMEGKTSALFNDDEGLPLTSKNSGLEGTRQKASPI